MNRYFLVFTLVIGLGVVGLFSMWPEHSSSELAEHDHDHDHDLVETSDSAANTSGAATGAVPTSNTHTASSVATAQSATTVIEHDHDHHHDHDHDEYEAKAAFESFPIAMQNEIKELSGRYNENVSPVEVAPGVFMMPPDKSIRVVPVAVMNEDGTVSIYEY